MASTAAAFGCSAGGIVLVNRDTLRAHLPWIIIAAVVGIASIIWYSSASLAAKELLGGSSLPGFVIGILAGAICVFEFLLWPRKGLRAWRIGRAKHWMRAHIWFGLLVAPLVALHCGFYLGGVLSTVLTLLVAIAILSGIFGLVLQNRLPRKMLDQIPAETIYSQIDYVSKQYALDAAQVVARVCGQLPKCLENLDAAAEQEHQEPVIVGAVRSRGSFRGKVVHPMAAPAAVRNSSELLRAFDETLYPFLVTGTGGSTNLADRSCGAAFFSALRESLDQAAHATVDELEQLCEQRRQFNEQRRMHRVLHSWITIHLAVSVALIVLLGAHVIGAIRYW